MALRLIEGFDDKLFAQRGWVSLQPAAGRFGGSSGQPVFFGQPYYPFSTALTGTVVVGVAVMLTASPPYSPILKVGPASLGIVLNGSITLSNGATVVATSTTGPFNVPNVWRYIEFKYNMTTGACTLRSDGVTILTGSVATAASVPTVGWGQGGSPSSNLIWDDLYVLDATGTVNNDFLGDVKVQTLLPNADGSNSALTTSTGTTHYNLVNEATPDTTSYVSSSNVGDKDTYQFQDLSANTASVYGLTITNYAHKDAAGSGGIANVVRVGGTDYASTGQSLSSSWTANNDIVEINPATGTAWTANDVNNSEFGIQIT
jgi:hypothetical protein